MWNKIIIKVVDIDFMERMWGSGDIGTVDYSGLVFFNLGRIVLAGKVAGEFVDK